MKKILISIFVALYLLLLIFIAYGSCFFAKDGLAQFDSDYQLTALPEADFVRNNTLAGKSFLWNPYILCGVPFFAHCETGFFYLPNIISQSMLPADASYKILFLIHILFVAFCIFIYIKFITQNFLAAVISASICILCGPTVAIITSGNADAIYTLAWLPFLLYTTEKFIKERNKLYLFLTSLGLGMSILAGELQMFSYMLIFLIIYITFSLRRIMKLERAEALKNIFKSIFLGILLGAVQVLPTIELTLNSVRFREYSVAVSDALPFNRALDLILPELRFFGGSFSNNGFVVFFGVLCLYFVILAMIKEKKYSLPLGIMIIFLLLSSFGLPSSILYYYFFPFGKYMQSGEELIFPLSTLIAIAAGLGWHFFETKHKRKWIARTIIPLFLIAEVLLLNHYYLKNVIRYDDRPHRDEENNILNIINNSPDNGRLVHFRADHILLPNIAMSYNIFSAEGFYPFVLKRYAAFMKNIDPTMVSEAGGKGKTIEINMINKEEALYSPLLDILNIKYIISSQYIKGSRFKLLYDGKCKLYENLSVLPRAFIADKWKVMNNSQDILNQIKRSDFEPRGYIYLEEEPEWSIINANEQGTSSFNAARIIDYKPDKIVIETNTDGKKILFISDTYYPGWHAYIDGAPTKIYRTDYAFRAVAVPGGRHIITFYYLPFVLKMGSVISLISLFFAIKQIF